MDLSSYLSAFLPVVFLGLIAWLLAKWVKKSAEKYPTASTENSSLSGVGGWLLLLIIGLIFLGPLIGMGQLSSEFTLTESQYPDLKSLAKWDAYKLTIWITFGCTAGLSIYAGVGLFRGRTYKVVKRAKVIIWIMGPVASAVSNLVFPSLFFGNTEIDSKFVGGLIASIIGTTIWTMYLNKSKRVAATYGSKNAAT